MILKEALRNLEKGLPVVEAPELAVAVHWKPSENLPIHRWFRYREGFSPYLLEHFSDSNYRLDPFCGCGTTLLESSLRGFHSYGIDLNPLATFITRTKTKHYSKDDRDIFLELGNDAIKRYKSLNPAPIPGYELLNKLFLPESFETLLKLKSFVDNVKLGKIHDLLLLSWLSILEKSSNVFKEGNGLKYRNKRRKPGKYITLPDSEWIPRYFGDDISGFVAELWRNKIMQISEDITAFRIPKGFTSQVRTGSCLEDKTLNFSKPIDLVIFSPPYANRFDYFEAYKIELWMGGFVKNAQGLTILRYKSMRNNLAARKFISGHKWAPLSPFLDAMDASASSVRMGIKTTLEGYFHDMRTLLKKLKPVLTKNGRIVIVVGNSAYAKSIVPTDALVAHIGIEEGYRINAIKIARQLHVSSQQRNALNSASDFMRESVIVMENAR